jgi:hypothetical protein
MARKRVINRSKGNYPWLNMSLSKIKFTLGFKNMCEPGEIAAAKKALKYHLEKARNEGDLKLIEDLEEYEEEVEDNA